MPDKKKRVTAREASVRMALCGMMAALSVALMLTGGVLPIATYAAPLAASLLLLPVRVEHGVRAALLVWLAVSLLALLLGLDKEAAFFYLAVGWYPLAKWPLDRHIRRKGLLLLLKAAIFAACVSLMYLFLGLVLRLDAVLSDFSEMGVWLTAGFGLLMVLSLLLYDRLLNPILLFYATRLRPKLTKLR